MSVKSLSAPKNAAYPLVVRKTLVAPEEIVCRGQLLYEIEDAQGRRMEVKTPFSGSIMGKPIATGTVLKSPQIILEIDESKAGEVEEAWMEKIPAEGPAPAPQKTGASSSADPPRSPSSSHERPGWHRVVGVFAFLLGPFLTWIALHLTHSLAGAGYRFGGLAIALLAPWLLYSVLPHKRNRRSATSVYRVAGGKGSITSVILIVASLILPPKVLSSGDCMWVHRLFAPITFAPLLEKGGRIYLLGRHVADLAEGTKGIPLSNGGLVTRWWGMGINEGYTGAVWSPRGREILELEEYRGIQVYRTKRGLTRILTIPMTMSGFQFRRPGDEAVSLLQIRDNEGRIIDKTKTYPVSEMIGTQGSRLPLPEYLEQEVLSYDERLESDDLPDLPRASPGYP